ncbi:MAG: phosphoribosylanthranilate isomerase [Clostridium sp.]
MTRVKICGICNSATAREINSLRVDAIGLVFAESTRVVTVDMARDIARVLRKDIERIGVFVNEDVDIVNRISKDLNLDYVQLHGDEDLEYIKRVNCRVMKAFSIKEKSDLLRIENYSRVDRILLDAKCEKYRGGEGRTFDWNILKGLKDSYREKLVLAGGLNINNINRAIDETLPYMVDVSSGVEVNGVKRIKLIEKFINSVKGER